MNIQTKGDHSASLATDRGNGTVTVSNANLHTSGQGSPLIYSTGSISLTHGAGQADTSEIGVVEGKNSISIDESDLSASGDNGFMLYQSFSGDAEPGLAQLTASNSTLTTHGTGAFIHVNNTKAQANLTNNTLVMDATKTLINAAASKWGIAGQNGGHLNLVADYQVMTGDVKVDSISSVDLVMRNHSSLTGTINGAHTGQSVILRLTKDSEWNVTGDSYLTELVNDDPTGANIHTNGHQVIISR